MLDSDWRKSNTIVEGERFEIDGLNIWDFIWKDTGKRIHLKEPMRGQHYTFPIYEITANNRTIEFAAGEYSNQAWGIYQKIK